MPDGLSIIAPAPPAPASTSRPAVSRWRRRSIRAAASRRSPSRHRGIPREDARGDAPRVAGHLAQIVHHREIRARRRRLAHALDQSLLVSAREARGEIVKAHALDLDVVREDAVPREREVPRALEDLARAVEELLDLAHAAFREHHPLGLHGPDAPQEAE